MSSPDIIKAVSSAVDSASDELHRMNHEIYNNPEVMFKELRACKLLSDWFESRGWKVKRGVYGIDTAFEARFSVKDGGRTICYNAEYGIYLAILGLERLSNDGFSGIDALPEVGHACGHNLIATSTLASAVGASAAMSTFQIAGTLVVMGTPAEETGGGKYIMANNGAWKDCDACMMTHAMPDFSTPVCILRASLKFRAEFHGESSHAAAAPWNGKNACDAIVMAYNGLAMLRQQILKTDSIQGVILEAGKAPNLIPNFAKGTYSIRSKNTDSLKMLKKRVAPIFQGAASATGCTVKIFWDALYKDVVTNFTLADQYRNYMISYLGTNPSDMIPCQEAITKYDQNGSSDMGNCTYITPGIQALFSIRATDSPHSIPFREAAGSEFAHTEALRAGKANALIGLDVLMDDKFYARVREEWEGTMGKTGET